MITVEEFYGALWNDSIHSFASIAKLIADRSPRLKNIIDPVGEGEEEENPSKTRPILSTFLSL
jgi:hypothetical protein